MTSYTAWTTGVVMAETSTVQLSSLVGRTELDYIVDVGRRSPVASYILIGGGGSESGFSLLLPQYDVGSAHGVVAPSQHHSPSDISVQRLNHFMWPISAPGTRGIQPTSSIVKHFGIGPAYELTQFKYLGSYSQNTEVSWVSVPSDVNVVFVAGQTSWPQSAIHAFSNGLKDKRPTQAVIDIASRITEEALAKTVDPEITVDVDGALSFDLRLANGLLILAELDLYGGSTPASIMITRAF